MNVLSQEPSGEDGAARARGPHQRRLIPVNKWPDHHPWPTVPGLRWMIFNAKTNGFDAVIRRVGRRVLIDEAAFFEWVEAQNEEACE